MTTNRRNFSAAFILAVSLCFGLPSYATAEGFPAKPIRLIIPFPAGGSLDSLGRILADSISPTLGQAVVIDNRPGASGVVGVQLAAQAAPDGYTLVFGSAAPIAILPGFDKRVPYDPDRDLAAVSLVARGQYVLVVNPATPAKNLEEFVVFAKAQDRPLSFGSIPHSPQDLAGYVIERETGVKLLHVGYPGTSAAAQDLVAGHIQAMVLELQAAAPLIEGGKLRALGIMTDARHPAVSEVPTFMEQGINFQSSGWFGIFAPAGTEPEIVAKLSSAIELATTDPLVQEKLKTMGLDASALTPERFSEFVRSERQKWSGIIAHAGIKPQGE